MNINLMNETLAKLESIGYTTKDVLGVYTSEYSCTIDKFLSIARGIDYVNDYYGPSEIDPSLTIVFTDMSRLERCEYDGSEWWEYVPLTKVRELKSDMVKENILIDYNH